MPQTLALIWTRVFGIVPAITGGRRTPPYADNVRLHTGNPRNSDNASGGHSMTGRAYLYRGSGECVMAVAAVSGRRQASASPRTLSSVADRLDTEKGWTLEPGHGDRMCGQAQPK